MRTNLPITQREYPFPAGQALVSTTDLQGRILYCNPAFIEVSGYTREELLGQPHNMIRHPDMPEEAFRDMWQTIESGQPWSGLVKNRRKNGDHYWVMANVTPLLDGDRPVGYMSVRTLPDRQQVSEAETLYARMREAASRGGGGGPRLQAGRLAPQGVLARGMDRLQGDGHWRTQALCLLGVAGGWGCAQLMSIWPGRLSTTAAAALLAAGLSVGVAALIRRQNQEPLKDLLRFANRLAAGDLTGQLRAGQAGLSGRLACALNQLSVNLMAIVGDTRAGVDRLRHTSQDLAGGNRDLAERTESQASSLEQTSASMAEITETVRHSADTARDVADVARQAADVTARSTEAVREVTVTVEAIADASRRIREITQVIDGIALQTNLLALNAAVEAARAGEQGRGFGVVAGEVRQLAQRTSVAAREIKDLIEDAGLKVEAGSEQTRRACGTMEEAQAAVQRMSELVAGISAGASEQLNGISQINEAVSHMDQLTQKNAALVDELSSASETVTVQAQAVTEAVAVFRLDAAAPALAHASDAVSLRREMKARRLATA
ncbi:Pas/Pac sensor containing methyl-accepting chemotaxis sensory transducer [Sphaerotilus natans subsp. natans DSM 6575]|uniref:Pas/Pac sensor containing methyl-accepting chemotaxis sensory transducer n=1 Tax=Sphaerotilus natans subsp. natans DSM 6575 TaxID=1286631 RepID=A0A059KKM3_9BURK|nr:PAS domain-containing methyl-accepting chemotaxis protein [Sphaerotilus natans]KDB51774.1 Pas/Pac sensor containing methyl-accepting chemotaxis sensory transducer [Sphaerotilus natans subsp. natans DSM 6575]SIQ48926.1 methyl-accepting chemotaxis sensory transducer with Pas/Pac sensor [Sphaerotilus natans]